jgi:hypothetical protein
MIDSSITMATVLTIKMNCNYSCNLINVDKTRTTLFMAQSNGVKSDACKIWSYN